MFMKCITMCMLLAVSVGICRADNNNNNCQGLPSGNQLRTALNNAATLVGGPIGGTVGGLFNGTRMWGAVVNRDGELCATATTTSDPTLVWPGSQAIAKAKAYTANAFSLSTTAVGSIAGFPLSTARLYTFTQPGRSLWSLGQSNLFDPDHLAPPDGNGDGRNKITGGLIFFGGGVALYNGSSIIGAVGVSGDTSCADHEIAKRVRHLLGRNPPGGPLVDDITYTVPDGAGPFTHPKCINTYRNGLLLPGSEQAAVGY
jgi:uncharacterized protein GlcG (DUF336 family)